jgi:hypothetical protein
VFKKVSYKEKKYIMKKILLGVLMLFAIQFNVNAEEGDILITNEWARPILISGRPGGAYLHIENITLYKGDVVWLYLDCPISTSRQKRLAIQISKTFASWQTLVV